MGGRFFFSGLLFEIPMVVVRGALVTRDEEEKEPKGWRGRGVFMDLSSVF